MSDYQEREINSNLKQINSNLKRIANALNQLTLVISQFAASEEDDEGLGPETDDNEEG